MDGQYGMNCDTVALQVIRDAATILLKIPYYSMPWPQKLERAKHLQKGLREVRIRWNYRLLFYLFTHRESFICLNYLIRKMNIISISFWFLNLLNGQAIQDEDLRATIIAMQTPMKAES